MTSAEPHEKNPNVNISMQSGMMTGEDKGKQPKEREWIHKAPEKEVGFDLERAGETFMEAKKRLVGAYTL